MYEGDTLYPHKGPHTKLYKMHTKNKETQFGNVLLSENIRSFIRYA